MQIYQAGMNVSSQAVEGLKNLLARRPKRIGTRYRKLNEQTQAVITLAYLKNDHTYRELAAGYDLSAATCWRYVQEGITVLARRAPRPPRRHSLPPQKGRDTATSGQAGRQRRDQRPAADRRTSQRTLKSWRILNHKIRSSPRRITAMVKAVLTLTHIEHGPFDHRPTHRNRDRIETMPAAA